MLMQGSQKFRSSNEIMRSIEDVGGVLDAGTYPEYINVVFGVHRKHWRRVVEIAADVILRPLFDPVEVEQEKQIITQEMLQHRDRDGCNISATELAYEIMFKEKPDEAGTRGSPAIMETFDRSLVEEQYRRFYGPGNMVLCLAGGFEFDEALSCVADHFGAMESGDTGPAPPEIPVIRGRRRSICRMTQALPQVRVVVAHPAYGLGHPLRDAARAAAHLLGGGLSSRLFTCVREDRGLVYDIESYLQGFSDAGVLEVALSVGTENLAAAVEATLEVIEQARADGFTEPELERHKEGARCGMEMLCDRPSSLADWFGRQELLLGPEATITPDQYIRRQEALAVEQVRTVMDEMVGGGAGLVAVGPYGDEQQEELRRLFPAEEIQLASFP
jgi:predicted Zn-dependent peptidase